MKRLSLHIGSPKTGSTSIQEILSANRSLLRKDGVIYPGTGYDHHFLYFATGCPDEELPRHFKGISKNSLIPSLKPFFKKMEEDFQTEGHHVLSTEYLFIDNESLVRNLLDYLDNFFDEITVYLFVRSPVDYYRSYQQQKIKGQSYVESPHLFRYKFRSVIECWGKWVPVVVLPFDKKRNSFDQLCTRIGIDSAGLKRVEHRTKKSMSVEQMVLFEKIQSTLYPDHDDRLQGKIHLKAISGIQAAETTRPELQKWVIPILCRNHHQDLEWLKREFDIGFPDSGCCNKEKREINRDRPVPMMSGNQTTVRKVFEVPDEEQVARYEMKVIDYLLKNLTGKHRGTAHRRE